MQLRLQNQLEGEGKMEELEYVTLEDGHDYFVVDVIEDYAYLSREDDLNAFCIRKIKKEGTEEFFIGLKDDQEFDKALLEFTKKHREVIE